MGGRRRGLPPSESEDRYDIVVGEIAFWRDETFGTKLFRLGIYFWVVQYSPVHSLS